MYNKVYYIMYKLVEQSIHVTYDFIVDAIVQAATSY